MYVSQAPNVSPRASLRVLEVPSFPNWKRPSRRTTSLTKLTTSHRNFHGSSGRGSAQAKKQPLFTLQKLEYYAHTFKVGFW